MMTLGLVALVGCADLEPEAAEESVEETQPELAARRKAAPPPFVSSSIAFPNCTSDQTHVLKAHLLIANRIIRNSLLEYGTNIDLNLAVGRGMAYWFGTDPAVRAQRAPTARTMLGYIENGDMQLFCNDGHESCNGMIARAQFFGPTKTIRVCELFWDESVNPENYSTNLIHELAHFARNNYDDTYGGEGARNLVFTDPQAAMNNASNHEYFYQGIRDAY